MDSSEKEEESQMPKAGKQRNHFLFFSTILLFFSACFSASLYFDWRMEQKMQDEQQMLRAKEEAAAVRREIKQLSEDLEVYYKIFEQKVCARRDLFLKLIPLKDAEWEFKRARVGVNRIASEWGLCNWGVCISLAYKIAADTACGTHTFEEAIEPYLMERLIDPLQEAGLVYQKAFEAYRNDVAALCTDFSVNCATRCQAFRQTIESVQMNNLTQAKMLGTGFAVAEDKVIGVVKDRVVALGGAAIELGMIKKSCNGIRKDTYKILTRFLSKSAGRVAKSVSVGNMMARADGPLKFGDVAGGVLTVGGLVWTSYDIYSAIKMMPKKFHEQLEAIVDQTVTALEKDAAAQAGKLAERVLTDAGDELSALQKSIKGETEK